MNKGKTNQYQKVSKINFMMADEKGNIVGLCESAAESFGIPRGYFEKKKALFNQTLNIKHINKRLVEPESEEELRKGLVLDFDTERIHEMVDRDFLTFEETDKLVQHPTQVEVYVQLMTSEYKHNLKYSIYVFVNLADGKREETLKGNPQAEKQDPNLLDVFPDTISSSAASSRNDPFKATLRELKKSIYEAKEPLPILIVKRLLYGAFLIIFALSVTDLTYYLVGLGNIESLYRLDGCAHYRRNIFVTLLEQVQAYREIAIGKEATNSSYPYSDHSHSSCSPHFFFFDDRGLMRPALATRS